MSARDVRFDGQFVTAVRTTGIYCRPSCPARTPKPESIEFFATSAAAHLAGYRACRRCLPEATPGSPAWNIREDTVARAMRLILDGVVERDGVPGLAQRLGYSTRQLNRLLVAELGAGPLALARAARAQTARQLIVSTPMAMSDIAFAAGFRSIRQFNDTIIEVFAITPSELRHRAPQLGTVTSGELSLQLPYREPFNVSALLRWFARRALPGVEHVDTHSYTRTMQVGARKSVFTICDNAPCHKGASMTLTINATLVADLPIVMARIRRMFDLDADQVAIDEAVNPSLNAMEPGIRLPGAVDPHELLIRAIIGQQVSVERARGQLGQLVDKLGERLPSTANEKVDRLFPTPEALAANAPDVLDGPRARTETVQRVSEALADGSLGVSFSDTRAELTNKLTAIRGIGPWTADYVAMRVLNHPDVLPHHDAAALTGAQKLQIAATHKELQSVSSKIAPWRSYLTMHLWRAAAAPIDRKATP